MKPIWNFARFVLYAACLFLAQWLSFGVSGCDLQLHYRVSSKWKHKRGNAMTQRYGIDLSGRSH